MGENKNLAAIVPSVKAIEEKLFFLLRQPQKKIIFRGRKKKHIMNPTWTQKTEDKPFLNQT
jgi:hypothetical protein